MASYEQWPKPAMKYQIGVGFGCFCTLSLGSYMVLRQLPAIAAILFKYIV